METKYLVTVIVASLILVLSALVIVLFITSIKSKTHSAHDAWGLALYIGIFCTAGVFFWNAWTQPRVGDLRVKCVGDEFADVVYETQPSGSSQPVKYKRREIACSGWRWEIRVEDREGEHTWEPVIEK